MTTIECDHCGIVLTAPNGTHFAHPQHQTTYTLTFHVTAER